ncbi:UNVERIFIED_CONTAM: hypothetical protein FKN15_003398 [Acipenser sinensis]
MESQCEYFMYFPAVPISELSDPARYRSLPRRSHLYLGETVRFLLVLRCRDGGGSGGADSQSGRAWRELAGSLSAVASVSPGGSGQQQGDGDETGLEAEEEQPAPGRGDGKTRGFRECKPLLIHNNSGSSGKEFRKAPVESRPYQTNSKSASGIAASLSISLTVTVWKHDVEKAEVREHGYLTILQNRSPAHIFREDLNTFKAQVSTTLTVLPPPTVKCQQLTVSGKYLTVLKVLNTSSQEEISIRDVRILPNFNASYLPMMPDGSVLLVDNVCHQSGDVAMASFYRIDSVSSRLPSMLSALEEHNFLFQLQVNERPQEDAKESGDVAMASFYRIDSVSSRLPSMLSALEEHNFLFQLQVNERPQEDAKELSQHMKLKLQFTASVSNPPPEARPLSRRSSPGSPAVRDLLERREASLGRSQSFSHQQPSRSHLTRTGSVMERRAITPPVSSPIGRPLYHPQEKAVLSLDKIAKRECKVLVVEPVK